MELRLKFDFNTYNNMIKAASENDINIISNSCLKKLEDVNFFNVIAELLHDKHVLKMINYKQHGNTTCLEHCINVAYYNYVLCDKLHLDKDSAARAGLLHDLFLYDWHKKHLGKFPNKMLKMHAFVHPYLALKKADRFFNLNDLEKDMISKHMWPVTLIDVPSYKETFIITLVDKYCSFYETIFSNNFYSGILKKNL